MQQLCCFLEPVECGDMKRVGTERTAVIPNTDPEVKTWQEGGSRQLLTGSVFGGDALNSSSTKQLLDQRPEALKLAPI